MRTSMRGGAIATAACAALLAALGAAPAANAAFDDPIFTFRPLPPQPPAEPKPPPDGDLEGPCGLAVNADGDLLVSDYYHDQIDVFNSKFSGPGHGLIEQVTAVDPLDGPCGLSLAADGSLYVNDLHRSVLKYDPSFAGSTVVAGVGTADGTHPTGVSVDQTSGNVYVDQRQAVGVLNAAGTQVKQLGVGSLEDGYGIAFSEAIASFGSVYIADAGSETVKVYSATGEPEAPPIAEIDGSGTPLGHFVSLRDAAISIDASSGDVYVTDNLQPEYTERQEVVAYVFDATGAYLGRLKYSLENSVPIGVAVDNSSSPTRGRVYVTSGNTERAAVYVYAPGSATSAAVPIPPLPPSGPGLFETSSSPASAAASQPAPDLAVPLAPAAVALQASGKATSRRAAVKARHRAQRKHRRAHQGGAGLSKAPR